MEQEQSARSSPLSEEQRYLLRDALSSDDIEHLEHLLAEIHPNPDDLRRLTKVSIEGNYAIMTRHILERKYATVDGFMVQQAVEASAINVLEVLRDFGWPDVNMTMAQVGPFYCYATDTALAYAVHDTTVVRYLLDLGANPNLGSATGGGVGESKALELVADSAWILRLAAAYGTVETFDLLLDHGAVLSNAAPMHAAAEEDNLEIMAHLLRLGVDVDERDSYKKMGYPCYDTPLMRAILEGRTPAVQFLLDHGASTMTKLSGDSAHGWTAIDLAKRGRIDESIRMMILEVGER